MNKQHVMNVVKFISEMYERMPSISCVVRRLRREKRCSSLDLRHDLKNAQSPQDIVRAVKRCASQNATVDMLCFAIERAYLRKAPDEPELRRLSIMQQQTAGTGTVEEFACLTVWVCACNMVMDRRRMHRVPTY